VKISLCDVSLQFPGMVKALLRIDQRELTPNDRVLIRGASGTGKTTLLHVIAGLVDPHKGAVWIDGKDLRVLSEARKCRYRRNTIGVVFQRLNILGHLTALENVLLGEPGKGGKREEASQALKRVGLADIGQRLGNQLSLGEQQRVAVARVLFRRPPVILADEPTSSLDDENANLVMDALFELNHSQANGSDSSGILVVSTHDNRIVSRFSKIWTIRSGEIQ